MATIIESADERNVLINLDMVQSIEQTGYTIVFNFEDKVLFWIYSRQKDCIEDYKMIARTRLVINKP